jgi:hypothetical protein
VGEHRVAEEQVVDLQSAAGGARQKIVSLYVPEKNKKTQMIAGSPAEAAKLDRRIR